MNKEIKDVIDEWSELKKRVNDYGDHIDQKFHINTKRNIDIKKEDGDEMDEELMEMKEKQFHGMSKSMEKMMRLAKEQVDDETGLKMSNENELNLLEDYCLSEGPKNDYSQHFVDARDNPQNFIPDPGVLRRFETYPKLKELLDLKNQEVIDTNIPIQFIQSSLKEKEGLQRSLNAYKELSANDNHQIINNNNYKGDCNLEMDLTNNKIEFRLTDNLFEVILIEPPLYEYYLRNGVKYSHDYWSWDDIENLDVGSIVANKSFIFIWCGDAEGLERGRSCLRKWGYRRCEDIVWIQSNLSNENLKINSTPTNFQHPFFETKEHCLMGIHGTVVRAADNFIHANIDVDIILSEKPPFGSPFHPVELQEIIERFCLGRKRLHIFGRMDNLRNGWVSVGPSIEYTNYCPFNFSYLFTENSMTTAEAAAKKICKTMPSIISTSNRIEFLRPKTPPNIKKNNTNEQNKTTDEQSNTDNN
ncbi:hypothetical protein SNEBB_003983 [Seison nebaliae]|nr:hypothetical protein SNEBB_003983 [Seison nebaliae]